MNDMIQSIIQMAAGGGNPMSLVQQFLGGQNDAKAAQARRMIQGKSPEELEQILTTLRPYKGAGRLITLFGCAGDRDRTKRAAMGEIVARYSDLAILTSDNPRTEDEGRIIDDTRPGLEKHKTPYRIIPDRYEAIVWALEHAKKDDILLLAGKGHEDYQEIKGVKHHFDDREVVKEVFAAE